MHDNPSKPYICFVCSVIVLFVFLPSGLLGIFFCYCAENAWNIQKYKLAKTYASVACFVNILGILLGFLISFYVFWTFYSDITYLYWDFLWDIKHYFFD
jgi:hypothetical protein